MTEAEMKAKKYGLSS